MAFRWFIFVLCLGASCNCTSAGFGYELIIAALEDFKLKTQEDFQKLNSNVENLHKSVANNRQQLVDQEKIIEGMARNISRLLEVTSKISKEQQTFNDTVTNALADDKKFPETCRDVSGRWSGVRRLQPRPELSAPFDAYCDQEYEEGGWTVIQNRYDGKVDFYRGWKEYEKGFGDVEGEYWLGLKNLHHLTNARPHELHVIMEDFEGNRVVAKYSHILVGGAKEKYSLNQLGTYSGDAGDSLSYSLGMNFSTFDSDNDKNEWKKCARAYMGAWWYKNCHESNLNGLYVVGRTNAHANMMCWFHFKGLSYGLKSSRMMIRATN